MSSNKTKQNKTKKPHFPPASYFITVRDDSASACLVVYLFFPFAFDLRPEISWATLQCQSPPLQGILCDGCDIAAQCGSGVQQTLVQISASITGTPSRPLGGGLAGSRPHVSFADDRPARHAVPKPTPSFQRQPGGRAACGSSGRRSPGVGKGGGAGDWGEVSSAIGAGGDPRADPESSFQGPGPGDTRSL